MADGLLEQDTYLQLHQLIDKDNNNLIALNLLAFDAFQKRQFVRAKNYWRQAQQFLNKEGSDQAASKVEQMLSKVNAKLALASQQRYPVYIELAEQIKNVVSPNDIVYIYAKNSQTSQPLAVVKRRGF